MAKCDDCGEKEAEFRGGRLEFCHECAHGIGLCHLHPDMDIDNGLHFHEVNTSKEAMKPHFEAYRKLHPLS